MSVFASVLAIMITNMHSNLCIKICLYYSMWFKYKSSFLELEMGADMENIWMCHCSRMHCNRCEFQLNPKFLKFKT